MFCQRCGRPINDISAFCPHCGQSLSVKVVHTHSATVILLLLVFFPIGLYLMWKRTNWAKAVKIIITVFIGLVFVYVLSKAEATPPSNGNGKPASGQLQSDPSSAQDNESPSIAETVDPYADAIAITAEDLYAAYDANEIAADKLYKGKKLRITGTVVDIGKDIRDNAYITLYTGRYAFSIQCYFKGNQLDAIAMLEKDQVVTVVGLCDGQDRIGNGSLA